MMGTDAWDDNVYQKPISQTDTGVWNDDAWKRICQLVDRKGLSLSPHQNLREYVSELEVKMGQPIHDLMPLDDRLKWLEYLVNFPIATKDTEDESTLSSQLEKIEKAWGISPTSGNLEDRIITLEQVVGRLPSSFDYDMRIDILNDYPIEVVNCFKRIKRLEDTWGIVPKYSNELYPFRLHNRLSELEMAIKQESSMYNDAVSSLIVSVEQRLSKLESIKKATPQDGENSDLLDCLTALEQRLSIPVRSEWSSESRLSSVLAQAKIEPILGEPSSDTLNRVKAQLDKRDEERKKWGRKWGHYLKHAIEYDNRRDEKMSDAASHGQSYTKWRSLCNQRILGIEEKWELNPTNPGNLFEARLDSLEFQLGLETDNLLSVDERLDRLEGVTKKQVEAINQVKQLEDKWGIASYMGQSIEDRIDHLALFKNVKFAIDKPIQEKIDDLWIMLRAEENANMINTDGISKKHLNLIGEWATNNCYNRLCILEGKHGIKSSHYDDPNVRLKQLEEKLKPAIPSDEGIHNRITWLEQTTCNMEQFGFDEIDSEDHLTDEGKGQLCKQLFWLEKNFQIPFDFSLTPLQRLQRLEDYVGIKSLDTFDRRVQHLKDYPQWLITEFIRTEKLEHKWDVVPEDKSFLETRIKALYRRTCQPYNSNNTFKESLDYLEKVVTDEWWSYVKWLEDLEQKCGVKPDKEHYGLVSRLEVLQHKLGVDTIKSSDLIDVRLGKLEKAYNLKQEVQNERNDSMYEGIILGPNPIAIPVTDSNDQPELDTSKSSTAQYITDQLYLSKFKTLIESTGGKVPNDMKNILELLPYLLKLQLQKSAVYGRSYCRHGDLSIFLNTERKWDRISNIMDRAMKEGTDFLYSDEAGTATETFLDTVVDLASYALLWVGYIKETHPEAFQKFLEDNKLS